MVDVGDVVGRYNEAVGLFYAGAIVIGVTLGALGGYVVGGGKGKFLSGGWIDVCVGAAAGGALGVGMGLVYRAVFMNWRNFIDFIIMRVIASGN